MVADVIILQTPVNCFDIFKNENIAKDLENYLMHLKRAFLDKWNDKY